MSQVLAKDPRFMGKSMFTISWKMEPIWEVKMEIVWVGIEEVWEDKTEWTNQRDTKLASMFREHLGS